MTTHRAATRHALNMDQPARVELASAQGAPGWPSPRPSRARAIRCPSRIAPSWPSSRTVLSMCSTGTPAPAATRPVATAASTDLSWRNMRPPMTKPVMRAARNTTAACTDSSGASDGIPALGEPGGSGRADAGECGCGSRAIGSLLEGGGAVPADTCVVSSTGVCAARSGPCCGFCLRASLWGFGPAPGGRVQRNRDQRGSSRGRLADGHRPGLQNEFGLAGGDSGRSQVIASRPCGIRFFTP
jgi:hypothetical protein